MNIHKLSLQAHERIKPYIRQTPLDPSAFLSRLGNCHVSLKLENLQVTGSFKLRGAANKLLSLSEEEKNLEIVTASSGNHGAAFAYIAKALGMNGIVYLPRNTSPAKIETLKLYDARIKVCPTTDCVESERIARKDASQNGRIYVSPYNDVDIIAGQATTGCELADQASRVDYVFIPVGGGGLISGMGTYLKSIAPKIKIIGCQPENSPVMYRSLQAGHILTLDSKPTLSDGTAGGIDKDSLTFKICSQVIDEFLLISEEEIRSAVKICLEKHFMLVEGAGALSVAAFLKWKHRLGGKHVILVISGSKISLPVLKKILS